MANVVRFKNAVPPRQQGELARIKVVQGPDYGSLYVLTAPRVVIGRGEDCDVMISDLKASRMHCELSLSGSSWMIKDLASANGILHNGRAGRSGVLKLGDTLTLGESTFEFITADAPTMLLVAPPQAASQVQAASAAFEDQKKRVRSLGNPFSAKMGSASGGKSPPKLLLLAAVAGVAIFLFLDPSGDSSKAKPKTAQKNKVEEGRGLASYLPKDDPKTVNKVADQFFKSGFREYREKNYIRAKAQFEFALQLQPGHEMSDLYLKNCLNAIDEEVRMHLDRGKKGLDSGKLREARGHYEAILRLLHYDQSNAAYAEARDQLDKVKKTMEGGG